MVSRVSSLRWAAFSHRERRKTGQADTNLQRYELMLRIGRRRIQGWLDSDDLAFLASLAHLARFDHGVLPWLLPLRYMVELGKMHGVTVPENTDVEDLADNKLASLSFGETLALAEAIEQYGARVRRGEITTLAEVLSE